MMNGVHLSQSFRNGGSCKNEFSTCGPAQSAQRTVLPCTGEPGYGSWLLSVLAGARRCLSVSHSPVLRPRCVKRAVCRLCQDAPAFWLLCVLPRPWRRGSPGRPPGRAAPGHRRRFPAAGPRRLPLALEVTRGSPLACCVWDILASTFKKEVSLTRQPPRPSDERLYKGSRERQNVTEASSCRWTLSEN